MVITCDVTAFTATGDTVETSIGSVTLPSNARRILAVGVNIAGDGVTTLENTMGQFRVAINNLDVTPAKFPIAGASPIGTDNAHTIPLHAYPVDWTGIGNGTVTFYVTMQRALTINPVAQGFVIYEKS